MGFTEISEMWSDVKLIFIPESLELAVEDGWYKRESAFDFYQFLFLKYCYRNEVVCTRTRFPQSPGKRRPRQIL